MASTSFDPGARIGGADPGRAQPDLAGVHHRVSFGGCRPGQSHRHRHHRRAGHARDRRRRQRIGVGVRRVSITIGGTDPNAPNVIAGMDIGIGLGTAMATIQGNFIGVDAAQAGVISERHVRHQRHPSPAGSTIGGTGPGEGNVIGGFDYGIFLDSRAAPLYGTSSEPTPPPRRTSATASWASS